MSRWKILAALAVAGISLARCLPARAAVGDPQLKTDHPWYPGELSCSTFDRLFKTQAEVYRRVTGRSVDSDEDKALASWYWRNLHFAHGEEGQNDCFGRGFENPQWNREYWTGLFAHGFALCGTTHAQYSAEMEKLLGHCRARCVGVTGHNSFEVYLAGGAYGRGRWALLDHDVSTVVFSDDGSRLLSIAEIVPKLSVLKDPNYTPQRQRGWRVAGLAENDAAVYDAFNTVEYLAGYALSPPSVHLRRGETLRRYPDPGLEDGKTFVFWGRNYNTAGIPGPERPRAWVNQPERMFGATADAGHKDGRVRYANAVYTYAPRFADGSYKEAVVDEGPDHVTFGFDSPYVIGCTPPNDKPWGVYDDGGRNGLSVGGRFECAVSVSTDDGKTWHAAGLSASAGSMDLTDRVKGRQHYWLRFDAGADALDGAGIRIRTVCQANAATIPHLHDGANRITFWAGGTAVSSVGPDVRQVAPHVVDGKLDSPTVTVELKAPRGETGLRLHSAAWVASGAPPTTDVDYFIDYSVDAGRTWRPAVKDWRIVRRPPEPADFWSQSFCWGEVTLDGAEGPVRVRFRNTGGKTYRTIAAQLVYGVREPSPTEVTFAWLEGEGRLRTASHQYPAKPGAEDANWHLPAGSGVETAWVEFAAR